ncbi:MAG: hypothetical protein ACK5WE_13555, partial [bacterium]
QRARRRPKDGPTVGVVATSTQDKCGQAHHARGPDRPTAGQPFQPFGVLAVNPVPQPLPVRPAAPGSGLALCPPSGTDVIAGMRRAALASHAFAAAARNSRADKSVRVIATAIDPTMPRWP